MKKENSKKIGLVVVGIVILIAVFYGGMVYGKGKMAMRGQGNQAFGASNSSFGTGGGRGMRGGNGGFTNGEIISKDEKSINVKLMDGGSKIIFLDINTKISKSTEGSLLDLATGTQVSVIGTANTDGSISAQSVQIRPQTMVR